MRGDSERLIKQVVASTVGTCIVCERDYDESSVSVLGHQEDLWFFSIVCSRCRSQGLVAALVKNPSELLVTDFQPGERERFEGAPVVGSDDILDVHEFLSGFDGDFRALFGRREP